jgi:ribosomal protein S18 acetylase RimI-like enzyme
MEASIRRIVASDWREMKRVRLAALAADRRAFGSTMEAERAFGDDVWIDRARVSATSLERAAWAAFDPDGRMLGMMGVHVTAEGAKLFGSWVHPAARGTGLGGRMLDALVAWVETQHPGATLSLSVNPTFAAAVRLYQSRGFAPTGASEPIAHAPGARCAEMIRRA